MNDDTEEKIKEEEESKRARNTAQFQFNYDDKSSIESSTTTFGPENTSNPEDIDDEEPYVLSADINLPAGLLPPSTMKTTTFLPFNPLPDSPLIPC